MGGRTSRLLRTTEGCRGTSERRPNRGRHGTLLPDSSNPPVVTHCPQGTTGFRMTFADPFPLCTSSNLNKHSFGSSRSALQPAGNTQKYRMRRVEQITGKVLSGPDVVFNPQLATRAWNTLRALQR